MAKKIVGPLEILAMTGLRITINGQPVSAETSDETTKEWILFLLGEHGPMHTEDIAKRFGAKTTREAFYFSKHYIAPLIAEGKVVKRRHPDYRFELAD